MSEPDQELKEAIARHFEDRGFEVTLLEAKEDRKTPDLLVASSGQRFLIEVKAKSDDLAALLERRRKLARGEFVMHDASLAPMNTIASKARDGVCQLNDYPSEERDFSLLWLHAEGEEPQSQVEQFASTLYGKANVYSIMNSKFSHECYFFHDSVFYRWRATLDGAILSTFTTTKLCINTYSPRYTSFRASEIVRAFDQAVVDPIELERAGRAIVADCDVDRRKHVDVIRYLAVKYNEEYLQHFQMASLSLMREFPVDEDRLGTAPNPGPPADTWARAQVSAEAHSVRRRRSESCKPSCSLTFVWLAR
ncbi:MAG: hypothetical protein QOH06_2765 [Acidobacteriota bacterium]|jgi:hypothetical protein|nr:hypothetical protein [Acidobacteriota bacterium]